MGATELRRYAVDPRSDVPHLDGFVAAGRAQLEGRVDDPLAPGGLARGEVVDGEVSH